MCIITGIAALVGAIVPSLTAAAAVSATATAIGGTGALIGAELAIVGVTGAVVGGVLGTVSAVNQAESAKAQAQYQADIEAENARLAKLEAEQIDLQANQERSQLRLKALSQLGTSRANFASRGVVLGAGTANDMEADIMDAYDLDKRNLNYDIATRAWQKRVEAINATNQSTLYKAQAQAYDQQKKSAITTGIINTTSSAISTGVGAFSLGSKLGDGLTSIFSKPAATVDDIGTSMLSPMNIMH
jgi:hypothetical protein